LLRKYLLDLWARVRAKMTNRMSKKAQAADTKQSDIEYIISKQRKQMATRAEKIAEKKLDAEISAIYHKHCNGIQIMIMDMPKIFDVAKKARLEGRDMTDAIVNFVQSIRKN
jgi:hypothetical protein